MQSDLKKAPRIPSLDGLRFLMCLGILVYHYSSNKFASANGFPPFPRFAYFTDVFFMLSGLFLARQNGSVCGLREYLNFLRSRLARIYPLHLVTTLVFLAVSALVGIGVLRLNAELRSDGALLHILLVHAWGVKGASLSLNFVAWSLSALFALYLVYPVLHRLVSRFRYAVIPALCCTLMLLEYLVGLRGEPLTSAHQVDLGVLRALPSFVFGVWLAVVATSKNTLWWTVILGSVAGYFLFFWGGPLVGAVRLIALAAALYVVLQLDLHNVWTPLSHRRISSLAKYGFGIYLLHPIVNSLVMYGVKYTAPNPSPASLWVGLLFSMAATLLLAMISYRTVEEPGRTLFMNLTALLDRGRVKAPV